MAARKSRRKEIKIPVSFDCWCRGLRLRVPTARGAVLACIISGALAIPLTMSGQTDVDTLLEQARTAEKAEDYQAAERVYLQALARAPGNLETLKRLGVVQQTEQKFAASIESFKQVLEHDAQYPEANFYLGVSYFGESDFNRAIRSFEQELTTPKPHPR